MQDTQTACMNLHVTQETTPEGVRRTLFLDNVSDPSQSSREIYFDLLDETSAPVPEVMDGFVMGILFYAMRLGQDICVKGAMTRTALRNLEEIQLAWSLWRKDRYRKINIYPEKIIEVTSVSAQTREAISAFSGGVDSLFTALRHAEKSPVRLTDIAYPLKKTVLLVHGFDVPLSAPDHLAALKARTAPFLEEMGLDLKIIRTNLKELRLQNWEDSFISQLSCCMQNYAHKYYYGLVGSSNPYDQFIVPWGSNPITDHLFSGEDFKIIIDGCGHDRTQKVAEIARHQMATKVVKVCWEGKETHKNCGVCEKCVRTILNFKAVGMDNPSCFETILTLEDVRNISPRNQAQANELRQIAAYAKKEGSMSVEWIKELERKARSYRPPNLFERKILPKCKTAVHLLKEGNVSDFTQKLKKHLSK